MRPRSDSKARLLAATAELMARQGYHGTGLNQIVKHSGAPKGSLYFHFPGGKEELAATALRDSGETMRATLETVVSATGDPVQAVHRVVDHLAAALEASGYEQGCPMATVVLEAATHSDAIQEVCSASYRQWEGLIAAYFESHGAPASRSRSLATMLLASVEGALLLSRAQQSTEPLRTVRDELVALVAEAVGVRPGAGRTRGRRAKSR